jgi:tetratricopeptide (TPR) repeat protein
MAFTLLRFLLIAGIALVATSVAEAQGNRATDAIARMNVLTISGNEKLENNDLDGALADYTEAILTAKPLSKSVRSASYLARSVAYHRKGDLDAAVGDLNEAIKLQPDDFHAFHNRGNLHVARKQYKEAIEDYSKEIKLNPKGSHAYRSRGLVLLKIGEASKAEADFAKYLALFPAGKDELDADIPRVKAARVPKP